MRVPNQNTNTQKQQAMKATEIYLILCQMDTGEITLQEAHEHILRLFDVICSLNCKCDYIVTAEQGHRVIRCLKCGDVKPI